MRILLVGKTDGNQSNSAWWRYILKELLEEAGCEVELVFRIREANKSLMRFEPEAVVVESNLPADDLPAELAEKTQLGLLTGYKWLTEIVLPNRPDLREKSVVCAERYDEVSLALGDRPTQPRLCEVRVGQAEAIVRYLGGDGRALFF